MAINRPFQVGIAAYQMAKLRILQFYYECLDRYIDRRDFELMQMDTDTLYFGLSTETLEVAVRPERREEFEARKKECFAWGKWSKREPGLFKLEVSSKRVSKRQNQLNWERYHAALELSLPVPLWDRPPIDSVRDNCRQ